ncbi:MAG: penicillin-insensitive murein endopeptidase [Burkholderiales bacterium]
MSRRRLRRRQPASPARLVRAVSAGGVHLLADGPAWQVMRLSRNRAYGHPVLIAFIRALSESRRAQGWAGLFVGDLAQPRGGPMRSGHGSHQTGLDADIWLTQAPPHTLAAELRETLSATSVVSDDGAGIADRARWTPEHVALLRTAAQFSQVDRIFVNPAIKRAPCEEAGRSARLTKIRPLVGRDEHMHVRLRCPSGGAHCVDQAPVPGGDGCDADLDWWFSAEAREELAKRRTAPSRKLTLADLPAACRPVLLAP